MWDRRRKTIKAWMLPLIVVGLVVPGAAGAVIGGPALGVAAGEFCALAVVIVAALQKPDEPIEIAPGESARPNVLVIAAESLDEPRTLEQVLDAAGGTEAAREAMLLVLAPARGSSLSLWLSDTEPARDEAQVRLVHSIAALAAAGVEARGRVGDPDLTQAAEDALRSFPASRVILVSGDPGRDRSAARAEVELRRRLRVPLIHAVAEPAAQPH